MEIREFGSPEEAKRFEAEKLLVFVRHSAAVINQFVPRPEFEPEQRKRSREENDVLESAALLAARYE